MAGNAAACESHDDHVVEVKTLPTGGGQQVHHVVVDVDGLVVNLAVAKGYAMGSIKPKDDHPDQGARCVVCKEPMRWVAIGRCGHRAVCNKCMVKERFFQQNKRCCICDAHCPKVLVTKAANGVSDDRATTTAVSKLPRFAFRDVRVGKYWYHRHTRAFFEEEKEYQAARAECQGIIPPFYEPWGIFAFWFGIHFVWGAIQPIGFALEAKNLTSQVGIFALSIFLTLLLATVTWSVPKYAPYEPRELEAWRLAKISRNSANN